MKIRLPNWSPIHASMFFAGVISAAYLVGIASLLNLSYDLPKTNQALILATVLGSVGTLLLALATFVNIFQTNKTLRLKKKDREKPLVLDELSYIIQPAIESLRYNLLEILDSEDNGCAYEWVYIDRPSLYSGSRGPKPVDTRDNLQFARLARDDIELYRMLDSHNERVVEMVKMAQKLHDELKPEIRHLLEEDGIEEKNVSLQVVTLAVLKKLDRFGDDHDLFDFWESHGEHLIEYANTETDLALDDIIEKERQYQFFVHETLTKLKERKTSLKEEYRISEDEIRSNTLDDRLEI